jgi:hypothetical protein
MLVELLLSFGLDFLDNAPDFSVLRLDNGLLVTKYDYQSWGSIEDCWQSYKFIDDTISHIDRALDGQDPEGIAIQRITLLTENGSFDVPSLSNESRLVFHKIRLLENKQKIVRGTKSIILVALGEQNAFNDLRP